MVMEHVGGGELFEYIIKHGKVHDLPLLLIINLPHLLTINISSHMFESLLVIVMKIMFLLAVFGW